MERSFQRVARQGKFGQGYLYQRLYTPDRNTEQQEVEVPDLLYI